MEINKRFPQTISLIAKFHSLFQDQFNYIISLFADKFLNILASYIFLQNQINWPYHYDKLLLISSYSGLDNLHVDQNILALLQVSVLSSMSGSFILFNDTYTYTFTNRVKQSTVINNAFRPKKGTLSPYYLFSSACVIGSFTISASCSSQSLWLIISLIRG